MEKGGGKWRFTSPTHVVHAFYQAMKELNEEGGIVARSERYKQNHRTLVDGMRALGFKTLLPDASQGPIITSFLYPTADFDFHSFYDQLKAKGFVIYPGKISDADTFRIGNIGDIFQKLAVRFSKPMIHSVSETSAISSLMIWKHFCRQYDQ